MKTFQTVFARALTAALLCACQPDDGGSVVHVEQLNDLKGPARTLPVDLREGANRAAAPSPDGSKIVFSMQGALWIMSPTGDRIAFTSLSGQLEVWNVAAGRAEVVAPAVGAQVGTPSWTRDGARVMLVDNERINNRFREGYNKLRVIDLATRQGRFYAVAPPPRQISERDEGAAVLSPDGSRVAFFMDSVLHVMPVNADGSPAGAPAQLTSEAADLPSWSGDSRTILYKSAHKLKLVPAAGGTAREVPLSLQWTQAAPAGTTLIRAGALWNGLSSVLQHDVDILVTGNRITSIGPHRDGAQDSAERFIDASTLTVMPGLWDSHVHPLTLYQGGQFGQIAALMLWYGLTSAQSVAGPLHQSIELREALEAGNLVGPRLFVSPLLWEGNRLFYSFARSLRTPEVADMEISKAKTMGVDFMKSYVRAPIPIMSRIAQGALDLGVQSGTHMLQPGAATGLGSTTHLSATQRMGYGWSKSFVNALSYQDASETAARATSTCSTPCSRPERCPRSTRPSSPASAWSWSRPTSWRRCTMRARPLPP